MNCHEPPKDPRTTEGGAEIFTGHVTFHRALRGSRKTSPHTASLEPQQPIPITPRKTTKQKQNAFCNHTKIYFLLLVCHKGSKMTFSSKRPHQNPLSVFRMSTLSSSPHQFLAVSSSLSNLKKTQIIIHEQVSKTGAIKVKRWLDSQAAHRPRRKWLVNRRHLHLQRRFRRKGEG